MVPRHLQHELKHHWIVLDSFRSQPYAHLQSDEQYLNGRSLMHVLSHHSRVFGPEICDGSRRNHVDVTVQASASAVVQQHVPDVRLAKVRVSGRKHRTGLSERISVGIGS